MALILPLRTERLVIRHAHVGDLESLLAIYADPHVARYLLEEPWTVGAAELEMDKRVRRTGLRTGDHALALVIEREGRVVGDIALWATDSTLRKVEIGWVIAPQFAGRGIATEAARGLIDAAVPAYSLHRIEAQLDGRNIASARVCEKLGMVREAWLRQNWWSKGEWTDTVIFGLLAEDLQQEEGAR